MAMGDSDITLITVLQHMQGMEQRLTTQIDQNHQEAKRNHAQAMFNHNQVMNQLDAIDHRLDDVEVVEIPKLKKAVGMK